MRRLVATALTALLGGCASVPAAGPGLSQTPADWLAAQTEALAGLEKTSALAWWEASTTGTDEAFAASRAAVDALNGFLADPERFRALEAYRQEEDLDPLVRRQLDVLYRAMLGKQVEPALLERITALESRVEQTFNTYRGTVGDEEVTQNGIEEILRTATDGAVLREAWEAQKGVGAALADDLRALVSLRNEMAQRLGYRDFYALRLAELALDEQELIDLFDELDARTAAPFETLKAEVDRRLADRYGIAVSELRPWHYHDPFFQEPPDVFQTGLGEAYRAVDPVEVSRRFYEGIGLEVDPILARSDLYEKPGKSPHAFASDLDRAGDVRILTNVVPGIDWTTTTVHELGHAVYDANLDADLPWLLREAAHPLTTEGLAMMLDRQVGDPRWAAAMGVLAPEAAANAAQEARLRQAFASLVFSRWAQVMLRFERALYANPDQDLNALWWDLVERYQGLTRPEGRDAPDYASKIHVVIVPVYYQNYMLGELFGAQLHERLAASLRVPPGEAIYVGNTGVGEQLRELVFSPGKRWPWPELVKRATGSKLSAGAFARRFDSLVLRAP